MMIIITSLHRIWAVSRLRWQNSTSFFFVFLLSEWKLWDVIFLWNYLFWNYSGFLSFALDKPFRKKKKKKKEELTKWLHAFFFFCFTTQSGFIKKKKVKALLCYDSLRQHQETQTVTAVCYQPIVYRSMPCGWSRSFICISSDMNCSVFLPCPFVFLAIAVQPPEMAALWPILCPPIQQSSLVAYMSDLFYNVC